MVGAGRRAATVALGLGLALTACGSDGAAPSGGSLATAAIPATNADPASITTPTTAKPATTAAPASTVAPTTTERVTSATPATSLPASTARPAEVSSVYFAVSGGIAGVSRSITIAPDGQVVRTDRGVGTEGTIDGARAVDIRADLDRSGLFDKDHRYEAPPGSADLFRYEISYRGVTVTADETELPAELGEAVAKLQDG